MRSRKTNKWIMLMLLCFLLYGCGDSVAVQNQSESANAAPEESGNSEEMTGAEDSIISAEGEILNVCVWYGPDRDFIQLLSGKTLYPELQEALLEESGLWKEEIKEIEEQGRQVSTTLDIHRADAFALSFVRRVWSIGEDDRSLAYQGCHYDTMTGEELALAGVITDTEGYAAVMAEELAGKYPSLAEQDGLTEVLKESLDNEAPEWTIGYQALTFYLPEELLEEAGIANTSSDENGYYIISVPYDRTLEAVAAECMQIPEAYAVSFETAVLPADESNLSLWQWRTNYDLDGDGLEEEIAVDYTLGRVVGEWQALFSVNGEECLFEGSGEEVSNRNTPYLIIGEDGTAYIALYMQGDLDGSGYMAVAKVSDDEVEPLYQDFTYLDDVRLTDPGEYPDRWNGME